MRIRVYPLEFNAQGGMFMPRDPELHKMACQFAHDNMGGVPNFAAYWKVFVACRVDQDNKVQEVRGLSCIRTVPDIEQMRYLDSKAEVKLVERMHNFLIDQGLPKGSDVFVYIKDGFDPFRCGNYESWLEVEKAVPAQRYVLPLR